MLKKLIWGAISFILLLPTVHGATVDSTDRLLKEVDDLGFQCAEPGENCPKLVLDQWSEVVFLLKDEIYIKHNGSEFKAPSDGFYVITPYPSYEPNPDPNKEPERYRYRFFPKNKVGVSPDEHYYACEPGREYIAADFVSEENIFKGKGKGTTPTLNCFCFWVPQPIYDDTVGKVPPVDDPGDDTPTIPPGSTPSIPPNNGGSGDSSNGSVGKIGGIGLGGIGLGGIYFGGGSGGGTDFFDDDNDSGGNATSKDKKNYKDISIAPVPGGGSKKCGLFQIYCGLKESYEIRQKRQKIKSR